MICHMIICLCERKRKENDIHANPSKFYILSLGFSEIEMKQGFVIGVYLLYSYGVSFTGVQEEGLIERGHHLVIAGVQRQPMSSLSGVHS